MNKNLVCQSNKIKTRTTIRIIIIKIKIKINIFQEFRAIKLARHHLNNNFLLITIFIQHLKHNIYTKTKMNNNYSYINKNKILPKIIKIFLLTHLSLEIVNLNNNTNNKLRILILIIAIYK